MSDATRDSLHAFTAKWCERWPEWSVAEVFMPGEQREVAVAWFALLQEFGEAAWGGEDPTPGLAKLAWWQEELHGWAKGARRHPLGAAMQGRSVPWEALAHALPVLRHRDAITGDVQALLDELKPMGSAVAQVESALFGGGVADRDSGSAALVAPWLATDPGRARDLLSRWKIDGSRPRRLMAAIGRARLQRAAAGKQPTPSRWRTLWRLWSAARH